jgi:D-beta-D-heptose 7-phosphate kinase/D-beta-D-heptose 1-phosphate adenosyltransferase
MKKIIVAVSGGMDPLHIGHINYLKEARKLGDKLVVILNSDNFLKNKKGYVFMKYKEREAILRSIRYVDDVVKCIDKDQCVSKTLEKIKPSIFAKGGDRTLKNLPASEIDICKKLGIKIVCNVGQKEQSSSSLVQKVIQRVYKNTELWNNILMAKKQQPTKETSPVVCSYCGTKNARGRKYCFKCGKPLLYSEV